VTTPPAAGAETREDRAPWPFPFADDGDGRLGRRTWATLAVAFLAIHYLALGVATRTGNFDFAPNHDHELVMREVLAQGYPTVAIWPPGNGYYMALTHLVTGSLGLPFWWGKLLLDPLLFVASGLLSARLAQRLTHNRWLAVAGGLGLTGSPLFALASAEGLAVLPFQPLFLASLLVLTGELQRPEGPRPGGLAAAGALLGLATLVRANPQFLLVALAPAVYGVFRRRGGRHPAAAALAALAVAAIAQGVVLLPWSLVQRGSGTASGVLAAPVFYPSFYNGVSRQKGNPIAEAQRRGEGPAERSLAGVVRFHLYWAVEDPVALAGLYGSRLGRAWYLSSSGRWDRWIAALHAPLWALSLLGTALWARRSRGDPALWTVVLVILYLWLVSALASGLARYLAPVYGLLGLLAAVPLLPWLPSSSHGERSRPRIPSRRRMSSA
jgi:hypothetical protein